jgi:hypothetical protein
MRYRDEQVMTINSANGGIRRVNAALEIVRLCPPPRFHRLAPLGIKAHLAANQGVLQHHELSRISGDSMSWEKDAPDSQAQLTVHHFFVRLAYFLLFMCSVVHIDVCFLFIYALLSCFISTLTCRIYIFSYMPASPFKYEV